MVYVIAGIVLVLLLVVLQLIILSRGLPVLMYHKVTTDHSDFLSVTKDQLEKQLQYLQKRKYTTISFAELISFINDGKQLPRKPVMLTFDDGYKNNYTKLYPLLKKYNFKANIFLTAGFVQEGEVADDEYLHKNEVALMDNSLVQFGLHTYHHKSYTELSLIEINEDIKRCKERFEQLKIRLQPCMAYTYGSFPKRDQTKREAMFEVLKNNGIQVAMRIGNRINHLPIKNSMLVQRIDIRGDDSFFKFKVALVAGRKIFFK